MSETTLVSKSLAVLKTMAEEFCLTVYFAWICDLKWRGGESNRRQLEWHAVSLELHELAMVSFRTFRCVSAWTE